MADAAGVEQGGIIARVQGIIRRRGMQAILYALNFGAARIIAYLGSIWIGITLASEVYGAVELALSIGLLGSLVLNVGIPLAVPQVSLLRGAIPVRDVLALTVAATGLAGLVAAAVIWVLPQGGPSAALIPLGITSAAAQGALGAYGRAFSHRNWVSWAESLSLIVFVAIVVICVAVSDRTSTNVAVLAFGFSTLLTAVALFIGLKERRPNFRARLRRTARLGLTFLPAALLSVWYGVAPRLLTGLFLPLAAVGGLSFALRIATIVLGLHQFFAIGIYARLYTMRIRAYDRLAMAYFILMALVTAMLSLGANLTYDLLAYLTAPPLERTGLVATMRITYVYVLAWVIYAIFELRVGRARLAHRSALRQSVAIALGIVVVAALGASGRLTVEVATWAATLQMAVGAGIHWYTLAKRGLKLPRALAAACGGLLLNAILAL